MIAGFSKLTLRSKLELLNNEVGLAKEDLAIISDNFDVQNISHIAVSQLTENVITTFPLPYSIVPNFLINQVPYFVPMVTEESSVVAAAAASAKFWNPLGGFQYRVISNIKMGHIHFLWHADFALLRSEFPHITKALFDACSDMERNMKARGGGILNIELLDLSDTIDHYGQIQVSFDTRDSMGANFINSCLEAMAQRFNEIVSNSLTLHCAALEIIMSILTNDAQACMVECSVKTKITDLKIENPAMFITRFAKAVEIANKNPARAITHNKGIMNGMDAVLMATGNDVRAVEAAFHSHASSGGSYVGYGNFSDQAGYFHYSLTIPMPLGTVGGIIPVHPGVQLSHKILSFPNANQLMGIVASVGLASNFAALRALVSSGIQKGHMKMHLSKILMKLKATESEISAASEHFACRTVAYHLVESFINQYRNSYVEQ